MTSTTPTPIDEVYVLDSSALTKRYVLAEPESVVVRELCERSGVEVFFSRLAQLELISALSRRTRAGDLHPDEFRAALEIFRRHLAGYGVISLYEAALLRAEEIVQRQLLRAADAVHVAAALTMQESGVALRFVTADRRQAAAAAAEGLDVLLLDGGAADGSTPGA